MVNFREIKVWFGQQPFVTKYVVLFSVLIPLILRLNQSFIYSIFFSPDIWRKGQVWRLFAHFFIAIPSVPFVMSLFLRVNYSYRLESTMASVEYAYFILFIITTLNLVNIYFQLPMMWNAFSMCIVYLWSKQYSNAIVNFFGGLNIPGKYLPIVLILWDGLLNWQWLENIIGCLVAHFYWFGREEGWFRVPKSVKDLINAAQGRRGGNYKKIESSPSHSNVADDSTSQRRRVFSGKSYKLGE